MKILAWCMLNEFHFLYGRIAATHRAAKNSWLYRLVHRIEHGEGTMEDIETLWAAQQKY